MVLNNRASSRKLYTVFRAIPPTRPVRSRYFHGRDGLVGWLLWITRANRTFASSFSAGNASLSRDYFGVATDARRDEIVDWVEASATSTRASARLGDIYHSTPVMVGAPQRDITDESYNAFRQLPEVATRPTVVYVTSNDGILHCFAATNHTYLTGPHAGQTISAGDELWGFVPPMLFPKLDAAVSAHQTMFDGSPVVKDVFFRRLPGAAANSGIYRTVLVAALRGGAGYIALDVTDPFVHGTGGPKFLWQYTAPNMGLTTGAPALTQVLPFRTAAHSKSVRSPC